ncbi:hypothetical protein C5167_027804 [Papaver somniferum]|nr:hypothetical protein C5167_027804 [Papaver somniferum]
MQKARSTIHHTLGRCTYHNKKHKIDEMSEKVVPPPTTEKWLYGHLRRDSIVHPSALEVHGKVSGALERNEGKEDQPSSSNVVSAELEKVFGRKQSGELGSLSSAVKLVGGHEGELLIHGVKAKPLKQRKAQQKEYDETDLAKLQKK